MSDEQYFIVNGIGMKFGRLDHEGGTYSMGEVVSWSEISKWGYKKVSLEAAIENGTMIPTDPPGEEPPAEEPPVEESTEEEASEDETPEEEEPEDPPQEEEEIPDEEVVEQLESLIEASSDEEEESGEEEVDDDILFEKTRDGLTSEEYWEKYKLECPNCGKRHRAKLDLFYCEGE